MNSISRTEENGALQFHTGTEDALADYVLHNAKMNDPNSVLETVDAFCWSNHWMMHVGDRKGKIVDDILTKYKPTIILELGTYCGYSGVRMSRFLPTDGHLYTIDPFPTRCSEVLISHAGFEKKVTRLHGQAGEVIPNLSNLKGLVDMVFIDHDKDQYLADLLLIEQNGLLHPGSVVVADNVVIFQINGYLDHVRNSGLYSSSESFLSTLEYDDSNKEDKVDGIEVSIWKS